MNPIITGEIVTRLKAVGAADWMLVNDHVDFTNETFRIGVIEAFRAISAVRAKLVDRTNDLLWEACFNTKVVEFYTYQDGTVSKGTEYTLTELIMRRTDFVAHWCAHEALRMHDEKKQKQEIQRISRAIRKPTLSPKTQ
jgi:hypothetical protein